MLRLSSIAAVCLVLLAGCGGSKPKPSGEAKAASSYAAEYPAQWKEDYFQSNHCGEADGDSTSSCECQVKYVQAHVPYKDLEEGSSEHAKAEEAMKEAPSHCEAEHSPAEEAAHNNAVKGQEEESKAYSEQEAKNKPEEEHLHEIEEKVRYEKGE